MIILNRLIGMEPTPPAPVDAPLIDTTPIPHESLRGPGLIGAAIFVGFFGFAGIWSLVARLDSAVMAPAVVKVQDNRRTVQHPTGGRVAEILVREGDHVEKDQLLVRLEDHDIRAQVSSLAAQRDALVAQRAQLIAARTGADQVTFDFERDRPEGFTAADADRILDLMKHNRDEFEARRASLANKIRILKQREVELSRQMAGTEAQQKAQSEQIRLIQRELDGQRQLAEKGLTPQTRVLALERAAAALTGVEGEKRATLTQNVEALRGNEMQIEQLKRDDAVQTSNDLRLVEDRLSDLEPKLSSLRAALIATRITAPTSGTVIAQNVFSVGAVVRVGERVLDIFPDKEPLILEAHVAPEQIDGIEIGKTAEVILPAFVQRDMPQIHGKVIGLSPDRLIDGATNLPYFRLLVEVDWSELAAAPHNRLIAGMSAEVIVPLEERTAFKYLTDPLTRSFRHAFRER